MKREIVLALLCVLIVGTLANSVYAQEVAGRFDATAVLNTFKSGKPFDRIGEFFKNNLLLWYTTTGGELNPTYKTQRTILDSILFFMLFFSLIWVGLGKALKDTSKGAKMGIALPMAAIATITLVFVGGFSIGRLLPYVKIFLFFVAVWVLYFMLTKLFGGKYKFLALVLAVVATWFAMNALNFWNGESPTALGGLFDTSRACDKDYTQEIVMLEQQYADLKDPATRRKALDLDYEQAKCYVEKNAYDDAKKYFEKVIFGYKKEGETGAEDNPHYDSASEWLRTKLFAHMAKHYPAIMKAEIAAARVLYRQALDLSLDATEERLGKLRRAKDYVEKAIEQGNELKREAQK